MNQDQYLLHLLPGHWGQHPEAKDEKRSDANIVILVKHIMLSQCTPVIHSSGQRH